MKNVTKHIKMKLLISPLKCFLCQVIILKLVYRKNKLSTVYDFYEKNRPHSDLWDLKKCAFLLAVEFSEVSYLNSTSIINKTMLDGLYRSRECLDHPESYHMEFLTYVLQNIATNKLMFSGRNANDPV